MSILIRKAQRRDSPQIWQLMQELAVFEKYIDSFAITPEIVEQCGFDKQPPDFHCLVAVHQDTVVGITVYYFLPFTAQNRPAIYLKELYVDSRYRGRQIGEQLMQALKQQAQQHHCLQIKWTVAPWNEAGQKFYARLGAVQNHEWLNYEWNVQE